MTMRTLYTFFRSSTSYRLRIALALKGLEFESRFVSLPKLQHRADDYMAINPQGLLPALIEPDGRIFAQSLAMLEYLDETYPEPKLLPVDTIQRAYVRMMAQIVACDMHPLNNVRVLKYLGQRWKLSESEVNEWYAHWIEEGFRSFETTLKQYGLHGRFCLGEQVSIADICLVPQVANARRFNCDLAAYPLLTAISARAEALDAFARAAPETQQDAF
jgi:maleylacetoacetate isomerase/maleylpyruvate isomerase